MQLNVDICCYRGAAEIPQHQVAKLGGAVVLNCTFLWFEVATCNVQTISSHSRKAVYSGGGACMLLIKFQLHIYSH